MSEKLAYTNAARNNTEFVYNRVVGNWRYESDLFGANLAELFTGVQSITVRCYLSLKYHSH